MKIIQVNDVHTSDKAPKWRKETYNEEIFDKLWQIPDLVEELSEDYFNEVVVAFTGDLFHNPQPGRVSHNLVNQWRELLEQVVDVGDAKVAIVPGNHDMTTENVTMSAPIFTLQTDKITVAEKPGEYVERGIVAVPWSYKQTVESVWESVIGEAPVRKQGETNGQLARRDRRREPPDVLLIHGAVAREENPFYPVLLADKLAGVARVVCYGHLHAPEEPYKIGGTWFVNPGALSRGALTPSDLERTPQVAIIDVDRDTPFVDIRYRPLACKPVSEIFRVEEAQAEKREHEAIQKFVESLGDAALEMVGEEAIVAEAERLAGTDDVREYVLDILRSING